MFVVKFVQGNRAKKYFEGTNGYLLQSKAVRAHDPSTWEAGNKLIFSR